MSTRKPTPGGRAKKKAEVSLVRSSAAEYLTFVAASGQGGVEAVYADENVWLTQKMMGLLYDVETHTVNYHLKKVFDDGELSAGSVIRNFRITAADGKSYDTQHYNLSAIIAVGYKVNSERRLPLGACERVLPQQRHLRGASRPHRPQRDRDRQPQLPRLRHRPRAQILLPLLTNASPAETPLASSHERSDQTRPRRPGGGERLCQALRSAEPLSRTF